MAAFVPLASLFLGLLIGPAAPQTVSPAVEDLINRNADFGARLYRAVASRTDDNVFLSPFAASAGMLALLSGTDGPTQNQLLQGLTLTGLDPQNLPGRLDADDPEVFSLNRCSTVFLLSPDVFQTLRNTVLQASPSLNLQQGTAVFLDRSFQVPAAFQDLVQSKFGGKTQSLSYATPADAVDTINRWVVDLYGDQVQDVLTSLDPQTQLLLFSAASYQSE